MKAYTSLNTRSSCSCPSSCALHSGKVSVAPIRSLNICFCNSSISLKIALETANALAYLHFDINSPIFYRDVKSANILLDKDMGVKVADFGLSKLVPQQVTHVSTIPQGTHGYVDPNYHQFYKLTDKSDVYSFGVVLMPPAFGESFQAGLPCSLQQPNKIWTNSIRYNGVQMRGDKGFWKSYNGVRLRGKKGF